MTSASPAPIGKYAPAVPPVAMEMNCAAAAYPAAVAISATEAIQQVIFLVLRIVSSFFCFSRPYRDGPLAEYRIQVDEAVFRAQIVVGEIRQVHLQVVQDE